MDIKKELKQIISEGKNPDDCVADIENQKLELLKKSHLLKTISLANKIEGFVRNDAFTEKQIGFLELEYFYGDLSAGQIDFTLLTNDGQFMIVNAYDRALVREALSHIKGFEDKFVNDDFAGKEHRLELKPGIGKEIISLFLSDELKKIYEYSKMQAEIPENDNHSKRLKM
jgi:hypothetical protein